jgi:hypothetical protein
MAIKFTEKIQAKPTSLPKADSAPISAVKSEAAKPPRKSKRKAKQPSHVDEPSLALNDSPSEDENPGSGE